MNSFGMKLASAVFLCAVVAVQGWVPGNEPNCTERITKGDTDYVSHHKFAGQYFRCFRGQRYPFACPNMTLFDSEDFACRNFDDPELKCANWPCIATKPKARYPDPCRETYYECGPEMKGYTRHTCLTGQHFDVATEECVDGAGVDDPTCMRSIQNDSRPCNLTPDPLGDPCKYLAKDGNRSTTMECSEKSSFNQTTCGCTTIDDVRCTKEIVKNNNKMPDNKCRASFLVTFDLFFPETGALRAYSNKISQNLNDSIQVTGATFANGVATLSSSATSPAQLYVYAYNYNELTKYVGFYILFRVTGTTTFPVQLFTNNYNMLCEPTLNITATMAGNSYNINAYVKMIIKGTTTVIEDTVSVNLQVAQANSYVAVTVVPEMFLRLKAVDKGPTGTTTGTAANRDGTVNFPATSILGYNRCGLTVGRGLIGDIAEFSVHEGCRNTTILMNQ